MAEDEPETVQSLLRNEIANNWIVETGLSLAQAQEKLPLGKLNVVFAEGKEPRLVLDSTVCFNGVAESSTAARARMRLEQEVR